MKQDEYIKNNTEQKQEHERLQQIEGCWIAITESTQNAILMMDTEGRVSYWYRASCWGKSWGLRLEEILAQVTTIWSFIWEKGSNEPPGKNI